MAKAELITSRALFKEIRNQLVAIPGIFSEKNPV